MDTPAETETEAEIEPVAPPRAAPTYLPKPPDFSDDSDASERAIPIRPADLIRGLAADPSLPPSDRAQFLQFTQVLGAGFHHEYYEWLVQLKDMYSPLDPDSDCADVDTSAPPTEEADEDFLKMFEAALIRANYRPLHLSALEKAITAPNELGLNYQPDFGSFEHLKVYVRGKTSVTRTARTIRTRFRKREVVHAGYSRLIVILKFRPQAKLDQYARSDVLYLRMFKDVPHVDMEMHLPEQGIKVKMRMIDKAQISSPILTGIPVLMAKVFFMTAFTPSLAIGLLAAPFTAGLNSFFGFQRAKQKHLAHMIRNLYYLTLANNASVINRLVDSAEEEDFKEALLAYFFLWKGRDDAEAWDSERLDRTIEAYLAEQVGVPVNFDMSDAARKLARLGLINDDGGGRLSAVPIDVALERLDQQWDDIFRFYRPGRDPRKNSTKI